MITDSDLLYRIFVYLEFPSHARSRQTTRFQVETRFSGDWSREGRQQRRRDNDRDHANAEPSVLHSNTSLLYCTAIFLRDAPRRRVRSRLNAPLTWNPETTRVSSSHPFADPRRELPFPRAALNVNVKSASLFGPFLSRKRKRE